MASLSGPQALQHLASHPRSNPEIENVEQVAPLYRHHHSTRHSASNRVFDLIGLVLEAISFGPALSNSAIVASDHRFDQWQHLIREGNPRRHVLLHRPNIKTHHESIHPNHLRSSWFSSPGSPRSPGRLRFRQPQASRVGPATSQRRQFPH